jgi:Concanavalin A-like lectin/glucanases superfamily/Galactose oxidase-like, Early set domain/Bacterial Ig domain/Galactose oxidase, central domain
MFLLPNGKLFDAGPDTTTRTFDLNTNQWSVVGQSPIDGQSAVMYRPGKILKSGTWSDPEFPGRPVTNGAATIDMTAASPAWQSAAPMEYHRSYHTLTVLPDGKVLATGGQTETDGVDETTGILAAEMWDPDTNKWTTMAAGERPRLYHSSALLLPDGRVLLAGGGAFGNATNERNGEVYSPPYLFKGPRPVITSGPSTLTYGQQFTLNTPDAARIRSATMVRMGSVTHNLDMDQRFMNLTMTAGSGSVQLQSPTSPNVAPPGMYMVFLLDDKGVPSVGQIIKVQSTSDNVAQSTPNGLSVTRISASSQRVAWNQSTDNVGVTEYRVYRSTTANFTPSTSNRIATVTTGINYTDSGLSANTYYYKVIAADAAGNASPASNQVIGDLLAPTVSATSPTAGSTVSGAVTLGATAADAVGVQSVQLQVDGTNVGSPDTTSPYSAVWDSRAATNGSHTVSAVATDAAGNSRTSATVNFTVTNTEKVAAFGFEEASGATVLDKFNHFDGTIDGATRVTTGRFGKALSFDGVNDSVAIPNSPALTPAAGLTVSAWVNPAALSAWRPIVSKERTAVPTYGLYASANGNSSRPTARVFTTADFTTSTNSSFALNAWTYEAMTWNGTTLRLFVNGTQVGSITATGALAPSTGALRLGGDSVLGQWFSGRIDEVRVYGRPLTAAEITADMNAAIGP